jgi:RNA polymerase sigma factor (sigma-70 family)
MNNPLQLVDKFPAVRLMKAQEAALAKRIRKGSQKALTELVMANMREALLYTSRVCNGELDESTRVSLCYQEMCMSAKRFKPGFGRRFFAFAKAGLRGRMKTYWKSLRLVRNAEPTISLDALCDRCNGFRAERFPTDDGKTAAHEICSPADDDRSASRREVITGEIGRPNWDRHFAVDQWNVIRAGLRDLLSDQQWMILDLVYKDDMNFPEIGKKLGLTRSAIHAAHRKAIKKLRDGIAANPRLLYVEDTSS